MTQASVTLIKGMQFVVETGTKHTLVIDSGNPEIGGRNTGARPMELVAAGVAGCTAMDVVSILRKMQQQVTGLTVKATSKDAEEPPQRFLEVHIEYSITGFDLDEKKVQRAIKLSEERYCPAMATIRPGARITNSYTLHAALPESLVK